MSSIEEGGTSTMPRHFNPNGSMTVEQMHMIPVPKPDLKSFLGDPTPLCVCLWSRNLAFDQQAND